MAVNAPSTTLTPRELDVVRLLAQGYRYRQIADELVVSRWAARQYIVRARRRLGAATCAQAVYLAFVTGRVSTSVD